MSINGALQIGRSAMTASQAALQVAGNNMANAATEGYFRRSVHMAAAMDERVGTNMFIGQGVQLLSIKREVDIALQARVRNALSDESAALVDQRFLIAVETLQNELTSNDLSSQLSEFFNGFSELANNPEDHAVRALVVQLGVGVASTITGLRDEYAKLREQIDTTLDVSIDSANGILDQISALNLQIAQTEQGAGEAGSLRDQRDRLVDQLSEFIDISVNEQQNGMIDILSGSTPIILAGESRGIELRIESDNGTIEASVRVAADGTELTPTNGEIGALLRQRAETVEPSIQDLDDLASNLIFEVNRLHSQGQGRFNPSSFTGSYQAADTTVPLNDAAADLPFQMKNGGFYIHVINSASGAENAYRIDVDPDAMSLDDLVAEINTVTGGTNVTASLTPARMLQLTANAGFELSFTDDTAGVLAGLGVNSFFTGENAATMGVAQEIRDDPNRLAAGANNVPGSNDTALALANLQDQPIAALGEASLRDFWQESVNGLAVRTATANQQVETTGLVRESLSAQLLAVGGVSLDEESVNLLTFERQFQAAARFISVIDEILQTLLSLA